MREFFNGVEAKNRASAFSFAEILKLSRYRRYSFVENIPRKSIWLPQHFGGLLRVAPRLVAEPPTVTIDLDATFHDDRPGDEDVMRRRQ